jgi:hypothetical protein
MLSSITSILDFAFSIRKSLCLGYPKPKHITSIRFLFTIITRIFIMIIINYKTLNLYTWVLARLYSCGHGVVQSDASRSAISAIIKRI